MRQRECFSIRIRCLISFLWIWIPLVTYLTNWMQWKWQAEDFWSEVIETLILGSLSRYGNSPATQRPPSVRSPSSTERSWRIRSNIGRQGKPRSTKAPDTWVKKPYWKWFLQPQLPQLPQLMPCGLEMNYQPKSVLNSWRAPVSEIKWLF